MPLVGSRDAAESVGGASPAYCRRGAVPPAARDDVFAGRADPARERGEVDHNPDHNAADSGKRLLIVEDDAGTRRALVKSLQRDGYDAIGVDTVAGALNWLAQTWDGLPLAGVVIDVHLPDGDGIDLTRRLRERIGPHTPIVVVSGDTSMDLLARLGEAGATRFVGKPMSLRVLLDALGLPAGDA